MANKRELPLNDVFVRINKVIGNKQRGVIKELCETLKLERKSVEDRLNGRMELSQNDIIRICEHYHCSADYLLFGKEE